MKNTVIIGAGGHCRSLANLVKSEELAVSGVYDESYNSDSSEEVCGWPLKGTVSEVPEEASVILAVGDNSYREKLFTQLGARVYKGNLVHKEAYIEENVSMGQGNQIFYGVYINSYAQLGDNNIINSNVLIEHEAVIGSHCHVAVGATVAGRSQIGDNCFIGAGAVIIDKLKICSDVTVGAGAVVIKDIDEPGVYVGNPARKIK